MATPSKHQLTINTKALTVSVKPDGEVVLSDKADAELKKLLELEQRVAEVKETVMGVLKTAMAKHPAQPVVVIGSHVKVRKSETGARYDFKSKKELPEGFYKTTTTVRNYVDAEKVDEYRKLNDSLPEGVVERERSEKVSIELVG